MYVYVFFKSTSEIQKNILKSYSKIKIICKCNFMFNNLNTKIHTKVICKLKLSNNKYTKFIPKLNSISYFSFQNFKRNSYMQIFNF